MFTFPVCHFSTVESEGGLPVSGAELWLDASDSSTITHSSGKVSQWDDKSGTGNNAVQTVESRKPTTNSRTQNGLNVIEFTADGFMTLTNSEGDLPKTVFIVFLTDNVSAQHRGIFGSQGGGADNGGWRVFQAKTSGTMDTTVFTGGAPYAQSFLYPSLNTAYLYHGKLVTSGTIDSALDNDSYSTSSNSVTGFTNSNRAYFVGKINSSGFYHDGWIGEIITFPSILNSTDIDSMKTYLNDKWSIY